MTFGPRPASGREPTRWLRRDLSAGLEPCHLPVIRNCMNAGAGRRYRRRTASDSKGQTGQRNGPCLPLQVWDMSKQDKDRAENGESADLATEAVPADSNGAQTLQVSAAEPAPEAGQSEQSRLFNSWLDRALPRLMEYLGASPSSAVTSPSPKAKH